MDKIEPYIRQYSPINGFDFFYYLHIRGGAGNYSSRTGVHRHGGEYDYILFYASPEQMKDCKICERIWCDENGLVYGEGKTIEEAYENYLTNQQLNK